MTNAEKNKTNPNENAHCYHGLLQDLYELSNYEEKMNLEISFLEDENGNIANSLDKTLSF